MRSDHAVDVNDRSAVLDREKEASGGAEIFCAFFGWLTVTGMTVLLTALIAAAAAVVVFFSSASDVVDVASSQGVSSDETGWVGVIAVLVLVFISYYSGGYFAGRMARFDGIRQGIAVFGWAVVAAIVLAVLSVIAGAKYDVLDDLNSFPGFRLTCPTSPCRPSSSWSASWSRAWSAPCSAGWPACTSTARSTGQVLGADQTAGAEGRWTDIVQLTRGAS